MTQREGDSEVSGVRIPGECMVIAFPVRQRECEHGNYISCHMATLHCIAR